jgi:FMN phosphatase YigB (HAD superfamily)
MTRIAFFDLDDTLSDTTTAYERWTRAFAVQHGLDEETAVPWLLGVDDGDQPLTGMFARIRSHFGLVPPVEELVDEFVRVEAAECRCEPEVLAGLAALRADGWTVGIVTNGPATQELKITTSGLDRVVDGWAVSMLEKVPKPYPEIFRRAARNCGVELDGSGWMVGDNPVADIGGAVLAGLRSVWIAGGRQWSEPAYKPDHVVDGPLAAIELLLTISPAPV